MIYYIHHISAMCQLYLRIFPLRDQHRPATARSAGCQFQGPVGAHGGAAEAHAPHIVLHLAAEMEVYSGKTIGKLKENHRKMMDLIGFTRFHGK